VVKSEFATLKIPELELEVPAAKKGHLNTIEGFLNNFYDELTQAQPERRVFLLKFQFINDFLF
jgi:C4-type Zn-finger protein